MQYTIRIKDLHGQVLQSVRGVVPQTEGGLEIQLDPVPHGGIIKIHFEDADG